MTATSPWMGHQVADVGQEAGRLTRRELRDEPARVLQAVREGGAFLLTDDGVPVGRIIPLNPPDSPDTPSPALTITRPAVRQGGWAELGIVRKTSARSLHETLDDLREERNPTARGDHDRLR